GGASAFWCAGRGFPSCARRYVYSPLRLKLARYRHIAQLDPHPDWLTPAFQPCIRPRPRLPLGSSAEALVSAVRPIAHTKSSFFTFYSSEIHPTSVEWDTSVPRPRPCWREVARWSYKQPITLFLQRNEWCAIAR